MTQARSGRRGRVFPVRITDEEQSRIDAARASTGGPRGLGPWLVWRATSSGITPPGEAPPRHGITLPGGLPATGVRRGITPPARERLILDLCGGSGAWSAPYLAAGYRVEVVTLPCDVRTYSPRGPVWGVLAAPPCTAFSLARSVPPTDAELLDALAVVSACLRVVVACRPRWWALENPTGRLSRWLGTPRDVWQPCDFGDPWTKRTAVWGDFVVPSRGPYVVPLGGMDARTDGPAGGTLAARRAVTPPGFARAFFAANP